MWTVPVHLGVPECLLPSQQCKINITPTETAGPLIMATAGMQTQKLINRVHQIY